MHLVCLCVKYIHTLQHLVMSINPAVQEHPMMHFSDCVIYSHDTGRVRRVILLGRGHQFHIENLAQRAVEYFHWASGMDKSLRLGLQVLENVDSVVDHSVACVVGARCVPLIFRALFQVLFRE